MVGTACQPNVSTGVQQSVPDFVPVTKNAVFIFPKELMKQLNRCQILILQLLIEICAVIDAKTGKLIFRDLHPTERWIAERLGFSREWVSKCLSRLARMGLVEVIKRRDPNTGRFMVNEYRLTKKTIALLVKFYENYDKVFKKKYVEAVKQKGKELIEWLKKNKNNPNWFYEREFTLADVIAAAYVLKVFRINDPVIRGMLAQIAAEPFLKEAQAF